MFYILNQDNQIAAADYDLLEVLEVDDLQTLFVKVVSSEITFEKLNERKVNIHSKSHFIRAWHEEYVLKSPFGDLKLVKLYNIIVKSHSDTLGVKEESFEAPKEESKILHKPQDVRPQPRNIFADMSEEKKELKPKRVSIFLDDDEELAPPAKEVSKEKIADIPNKKVQEDLEFASQRLMETKVDKKPILETLRVQDEVVNKPLATQEPIVAKPIFEEPIKQQSTQEKFNVQDDLKLGKINLDTIETDEASIDELLALANQQAESIHEIQTQKIETKPIEPEPTIEETLKLDESHEDEPLQTIALDESKDETSLDEALLLLDEEPEDTNQKSKELFIEEDETPKEIGDLLLDDDSIETQDNVIDQKLSLDDEADMASLLLAVDEIPTQKAPLQESPKVQPKEEIESFDNLLLLDDEEPIKTQPKAQPKAQPKEEVESFDNLLLLDDEEPIKPQPKAQPKAQPKEEDVESFDDLLLLDDEEPIKTQPKAQPKEEDVESFDDLLLLDDEAPKRTPIKEESVSELNTIKDLLLEIEEEPKAPKKIPVKSYSYPDAIEIDLDEHGEMIGLGAEDYQEFLNEFIDKSIVYDEDLRSTDKSKREEALNEIYSISQSLQLPYLEDILADMLERDYLEEELVDIYYDCLAKITTKTKPKVVEAPPVQEKPKETPVRIEEPKTQDAPISGGYGVLSFEGIKPIHFDFRLEEAAEDLSLPVDLIEEFVNDFIEQAIEEKETFIKAYAKGDMDTIQKTGHKLKGASSNLRIIPLSETLEEIQHCDNPARFEPLLKKYWGQFLSFKLFMENISHK